MEYITTYVVNLKDKIHRWGKFDELNLGVERIDAVDTRTDSTAAEKFGLQVKPPDLCTKLYFAQCKGALGCYLSHYIFWKNVVDNDLEYALVLEDDALVSDAEKLLTTDIIDAHFEGVTTPKLVQFNKRDSIDKLPFWFEGTESYAINNKAARSLIKLTHDFSDMCDTFIEYAWSWPNLGMTHLELFERWSGLDSTIDYRELDTIRYAADKFLGYCSHPSINDNDRLRIVFDPQVELFDNLIVSDVIGDSTPIWKMSYQEIEKRMDELGGL